MVAEQATWTHVPFPLHVPASPLHAAPPGSGAVPHVWFMHVAISQTGAPGQSDGTLHPTH
jgi:hypothetical protein